LTVSEVNRRKENRYGKFRTRAVRSLASHAWISARFGEQLAAEGTSSKGLDPSVHRLAGEKPEESGQGHVEIVEELSAETKVEETKVHTNQERILVKKRR
jgi:hypothetical protein